MLQGLLQVVTGCPRDYEDLYYSWRPFTFKMVHRYLPDTIWYEKEDIVDSLISEFCCLDYLNPEQEHGFTWRTYWHGSEIRLVQFSTFYGRFCVNRIRNLNYHQFKSNRMQRCGVEEGEIDVPVQIYDIPSYIDCVLYIKENLDSIPTRRGSNKDLAALFLFLVESLVRYGRVYIYREHRAVDDKGNEIETICSHFRITRSAADQWLNDLSCCDRLKELLISTKF